MKTQSRFHLDISDIVHRGYGKLVQIVLQRLSSVLFGQPEPAKPNP
jgi:hypothetical protein